MPTDIPVFGAAGELSIFAASEFRIDVEPRVYERPNEADDRSAGHHQANRSARSEIALAIREHQLAPA